jgi:hypothetical protein
VKPALMRALREQRRDRPDAIDAEALASKLQRIRPAGEHLDRRLRRRDLEQLRIDEINRGISPAESG